MKKLRKIPTSQVRVGDILHSNNGVTRYTVYHILRIKGKRYVVYQHNKRANLTQIKPIGHLKSVGYEIERPHYEI